MAGLNTYVFLPVEEAGELCQHKAARTFETADDTGPISIIVICPKVFTSDKLIDTLSSVGLREGDKIGSFEPRSGILLHETFHVALGDAMLDTDETCK